MGGNFVMKKCFLFLVFLFLVGELGAVGSAFLTIFPGARATGLAAAYSARGDDATASYYNPALLGFFDNSQIVFIHAPWLRGLAPDMYYEFFGFVKNMGGGRALGGHITYITAGKVEAEDEEGRYYGTFTPFGISIDVAYGIKLNKNFAFGVGGKFVYCFLVPAHILREIFGDVSGGGSASTFALDVGINYRKSFNLKKVPMKFSFGTALVHLGPGLKYLESGDRDPLPTTFRIGLAYWPLYTKLFKVSLSFDLNKVVTYIADEYRDSGASFIFDEAWKHFGLEVKYYDLLALRLGYFYDKYGERKGLTFGLGVELKGFRIDIADDSRIYAFEEKQNKRFGIGYVFKKSIKTEKKSFEEKSKKKLKENKDKEKEQEGESNKDKKI